MPLYDYFCSDCDFKAERLVRRDEEVVVLCYSCGRNMSRLISTFSINTDTKKWDLRPRPDNPNIETDRDGRVEIQFVDQPLNKEGLPVAPFPTIPVDTPKEMIPLVAPKYEDWDPPKGTVHPADFVKDEHVTKEYRERAKKGLKI